MLCSARISCCRNVAKHFYLLGSAFLLLIIFARILTVNVRFQGALLLLAMDINMLQDIVFRAKMCLPRKCTEYAKHHAVSKNAHLFWSHALACMLQHMHLFPVFWLAHFRQMHLAHAPVMNDNACLLCTATINHLSKCILKYITAVTFHHSLVSTNLFAWHLVGDKS